MKYRPDFILIDRLVEHLPTTVSILDKFKGVDTTVIEDVRAIKRPGDFSQAKKTMLITANRGYALKPCQGMSPTHLCCNYWVIDLISNCPMDCSYCILQHYLGNNPLLTIYTNIDEMLTHTSMFVANHREKTFRIGTGELSDSLVLDHITGFSKKLIEYFSHQPNATLELKTKTANISHLLKLKHNDRTVIAWSVNPEKIISSEEAGTATLEERLNAAKKVVEAGYKAAFHFDPIIHSDNWEGEYKGVVEKILDTLPHNKIAWISLGALRFPMQMKEVARKRFPESRIFYGELVPTNGKARYFKPIREKIYSSMLEWLKPIKKTTPIYLCMETRPIWNKLMPDKDWSNATIERHIQPNSVQQHLHPC